MSLMTAEWLPSLEPGWGLTPLKRLCTIETGTADTQDADLAGEYDFVIRSPHLKRATSFTFDCEAIVTAGDGAVGEVFHHLNGKFLAHQRTYVLHDFKEVDPRYLYYYFSSHFRFMCQDGSAKTTVDSVRRWMLTDMPVVIPPVSRQRSIAQFLDSETAKIDHLIAKQRELLDLLGERQMRMRDSFFSGYVGSGERLKWFLVEQNSRLGNVNSDDRQLLSVSIHWGVSPRSEAIGEESSAVSFEKYKTVEVGDIILNRMRAFQGAVGFSSFNGFTSPDYAVFRPSSEVDSSWLMQAMKTKAFVGEMRRRLTGIGGTEGGKVRTPRINTDDLLDIRINLPSKSTQVRDMFAYQERVNEVLKVKEKANRMIDLLQERRSALITAAVTGQIEV